MNLKERRLVTTNTFFFKSEYSNCPLIWILDTEFTQRMFYNSTQSTYTNNTISLLFGVKLI